MQVRWFLHPLHLQPVRTCAGRADGTGVHQHHLVGLRLAASCHNGLNIPVRSSPWLDHGGLNGGASAATAGRDYREVVMIEFSCSQCRKRLKVQDEAADKLGTIRAFWLAFSTVCSAKNWSLL